jgi:hypothetical protein
MGASNSSTNNRRNTRNSMGASNSMDISNIKVTINRKDTTATAGMSKMEMLKSSNLFTHNILPKWRSSRDPVDYLEIVGSRPTSAYVSTARKF